jgi:hypothetical protein
MNNSSDLVYYQNVIISSPILQPYALNFVRDTLKRIRILTKDDIKSDWNILPNIKVIRTT